LGITLRHFDLGGKIIALDGRYREEGGNNNGAAVATWFAVGVFAGFIKGKSGIIPKGRELKARTGEDIAFTLGVSQPAVVIADEQQAPDVAEIDLNKPATKPVTEEKNSTDTPIIESKTGELK
jgi:hypothetical protein